MRNKMNCKMNCRRRFGMESSWMGTRAIERQRFKEGRFVMAEAAAAASGSSEQGDGENIAASVLPYVGVGAVMLGIGYHLGGYLLSKSTAGSTSSTVAARVLVVAANIIGTTIASSLLDKLGCKDQFLPTILDLAQSEFDSLVKIIRRDQQHKKETRTWKWDMVLDSLTSWLCYSILFSIVAICWWFGGIVGALFFVVCLISSFFFKE